MTQMALDWLMHRSKMRFMRPAELIESLVKYRDTRFRFRIIGGQCHQHANTTHALLRRARQAATSPHRTPPI